MWLASHEAPFARGPHWPAVHVALDGSHTMPFGSAQSDGVVHEGAAAPESFVALAASFGGLAASVTVPASSGPFDAGGGALLHPTRDTKTANGTSEALRMHDP
jgi:hypothetical protein